MDGLPAQFYRSWSWKGLVLSQSQSHFIICIQLVIIGEALYSVPCVLFVVRFWVSSYNGWDSLISERSNIFLSFEYQLKISPYLSSTIYSSNKFQINQISWNWNFNQFPVIDEHWTRQPDQKPAQFWTSGKQCFFFSTIEHVCSNMYHLCPIYASSR